MDFTNPLGVVTPTLDGEVLRVLVLADADFSVGQIAGLLPNRSKRGVAKVLDRLVGQGIVEQTHAGSPHLYRLNRDHLAADAILALATQKSRLIERLRSSLLVWPVPPVYAALFGSGARSDHAVSSDIDLFLVRPDQADEDDWQEQVSTFTAATTRWTGNDTRAISYTAAEVKRLAQREPLFANVVREGIHLAGDHGWLTGMLRRKAS